MVRSAFRKRMLPPNSRVCCNAALPAPLPAPHGLASCLLQHPFGAGSLEGNNVLRGLEVNRVCAVSLRSALPA